jgi:hypothetical protein
VTTTPPPAVPPRKLTVDEYLRNLRAVGDTRFPYKDHPRGDVLDPAFAAFARATADFVDAMRAHSPGGYTAGRTAVMAVAVNLPMPVADVDAEVARLRGGLALMPTAAEPERPAP